MMSEVNILAALFVIAGLLAGCAAPPAPQAAPAKGAAPPVSAPAAAPAATPAAPTAVASPSAEKARYGGTLRQPIYDDIPSLDPHRETWFGVMQLGEHVWDGILRFDSDTGKKIEPGLAQKWETNPDGTVITFTLKQGVKWHDGKPFTSADAKYSVERLMSPPKGFRNPRVEAFEMIGKVEAPSDDKLVLTLKYPNILVFEALAYAFHKVLPKHIVEPLEANGIRDVRQVIGTGPFKLQNYTRGVSFTVVKNPDFWKPGLPYLDSVQNYVVPDSTSRVAAFRTKRLDILEKTPGIMPPQVAILKNEPNAVITEGLVSSLWGLWMNPKIPGPLADVRVRKAIHLLIDRDKLQDILSQSVIRGEPGGLLYPTHPFAQPKEEIAKWPGFRQPKDADLAEARKLLEQAGYPRGFEMSLLTRRRAGDVENATAVVDQLNKFGIAAKIDIQETTSYFDIQEKGRYTSSVNAFGAWSPEPHFTLAQRFKTGGGRNYEGTSEARVDSKLEEEVKSLDPEKRKQLVREVEQVLLNDVVVSAPLYWKRNATAYWNTVKGYSGINAQGTWGGFSMEAVWLAK
ncbi:MAG: ABC transporter substrate-binding protein [Chloroflexi bacterium]|nr:ABC transporter substrate-binding protein [Chloroflexota bacterium]